MLTRIFTFWIFILGWTDAFWLQPGMNNIVACCDVISYNATELKFDQKKPPNVILNDTRIDQLSNYQNLDSSLQPEAVLLPFVSSWNFQLHNWYNVCLRRNSSTSGGNYELSSFCFPFRPCECECTNTKPWLRILITSWLRSDGKLSLKLRSTFSPDTPLVLEKESVKFHITLQSRFYMENCNALALDTSSSMEDEERESRRNLKQECQRAVQPIQQNIKNLNEDMEIEKSWVDGVPFYMTIIVTIQTKIKGWARDFVHKLDSFEVHFNETDQGYFERSEIIPIPTPRIEDERLNVQHGNKTEEIHEAVLELSPDEVHRICPIVLQKGQDCENPPCDKDCRNPPCSISSMKAYSIFSLTLGLTVFIGFYNY